MRDRLKEHTCGPTHRSARRTAGMVTILLVFLAALGCEARSVDQPPEPVAAPVIEAALPNDSVSAPDVLDRIAVIGASATDGFGVVAPHVVDGKVQMLHVTLSDVLQAALVGAPHDKLSSVIAHCGDMYFYADPHRIGPGEVDCALAAEPTLVIAVDYLFWYGYGNVGPDGAGLRKQMDRIKLLEIGLSQLERFNCPIVLGDYPDMSPAVGMLLNESQMPSKSVLDALNARRDAWVAKHPKVISLPLAEFVETIRNGRPLTVGDYTWTASDTAELIMADNLHPSYRGLIATVQMIADALQASGLVESSEFDSDPRSVTKRLRAPSS